MERFLKTFKKLIRHRSILVGGIMLAFMITLTVASPMLTEGREALRPVMGQQLNPPSWEHPFGTDNQGRDIFARVLLGGRYSLITGLIAVSIAATGGVILGLIAGYSGGIVDDLIGRILDVWLSFPGIIMAILIILILGPGLFNVMFAVGISRIPRFARLARGSTIALRESDFVSAALAAGASKVSIMVRHILPNILAPLLVFSTMSVGGAILMAASMGFLGLGAQPPTPEWGIMLSGSRNFMFAAPWTTTFPGIAIMISVIGINLIGDGLRDVLDPRMRGRGAQA